ncbi:hypothetical protein [Chromatium okenii]|uniref:hypothetical protein n=1 Tax=Chromatium okenii TaxID=61644 RepID=UPI0019048346|nr:hypothetical protein [Chromatium okenii]
MKSELNPEFLQKFRSFPERVKQVARKNYCLCVRNPTSAINHLNGATLNQVLQLEFARSVLAPLIEQRMRQRQQIQLPSNQAVIKTTGTIIERLAVI